MAALHRLAALAAALLLAGCEFPVIAPVTSLENVPDGLLVRGGG